MEELAKRLGADIFGVADLDLIRDYPTIPENLFEGFSRGIVIGVKLSDAIFDNLPVTMPLYARHYAVANQLLDRITFALSREIERRGYRDLPIPASKILKDSNWRSFVSHKAIARASGVGWIGKSLLLVTEEFGPRVRLATILTDMPLEAGEPVKNKCGKCRRCVDSCVAKALKGVEFEDYPKREDVLDVEKCAAKLQEFSTNPDVGELICGICIKVCPFGLKKLGGEG